MKRPKLGKWVKASRVRIVKNAGKLDIQIQRIAKKKRAPKKRRR